MSTLPIRGRPKLPSIFLVIAALIVLGGIALWILNVRGVLPESWWTAIGATFTVVGAVSALVQLLAQSSAFSPTPPPG